MWLKSSTAPISTIRSPLSGSNPVVSVSSTISRIDDLSPDLAQDILNALPRLFKSPRWNHVIRARPLLRVRKLTGKNGLEPLFRHSRPGQDANALCFWRGRYDDSRIDPGVRAGLEKKRDVDEHDVGVCRGDELLAILRDEGMHHRLDAAQGVRFACDPELQPFAANVPVYHGVAAKRADLRHGCASLGVEPVHCIVGVPDRHALVSEHLRRRTLSHTDGARQADDKGSCHADRIVCLRPSSTSGRTPNQRSKPGTAWWRSIPSPSTVRQPACRARRRSMVSSGA